MKDFWGSGHFLTDTADKENSTILEVWDTSNFSVAEGIRKCATAREN